MNAPYAADRLQPALLDRLTDLEPTQKTEPESARVMSRAQIRAAVLRDLSWLLNALQSLDPALAERFPEVVDSVLNYGMPALAGQTATRIDIPLLERTFKLAIERFEPRVMKETLEVRALETSSVLDTNNVFEFEIRGHIWAQPVPLDMLLRTQLDLEVGQIEVRDLGAGTSRAMRA